MRIFSRDVGICRAILHLKTLCVCPGIHSPMNALSVTLSFVWCFLSAWLLLTVWRYAGIGSNYPYQWSTLNYFKPWWILPKDGFVLSSSHVYSALITHLGNVILQSLEAAPCLIALYSECIVGNFLQGIHFTFLCVERHLQKLKLQKLAFLA